MTGPADRRRLADVTLDNVGRCTSSGAVSLHLDPAHPGLTAISTVSVASAAGYYIRRCVLPARHRGACQVETRTGRQIPIGG